MKSSHNGTSVKASFKDVIDSNELVLIDFFAEWCGPCKILGPILKQVKDELGDSVKIIKIDVDKNQRLTATYKVLGVPTLLLFKQGKLVWRQSGVIQKQEIISLLRSQSI